MKIRDISEPASFFKAVNTCAGIELVLSEPCDLNKLLPYIDAEE